MGQATNQPDNFEPCAALSQLSLCVTDFLFSLQLHLPNQSVDKRLTIVDVIRQLSAHSHPDECSFFHRCEPSHTSIVRRLGGLLDWRGRYQTRRITPLEGEVPQHSHELGLLTGPSSSLSPSMSYLGRRFPTPSHRSYDPEPATVGLGMVMVLS
jgi:hypothetical protein